MHPDLDEFLERVFAPVQPVSKSIGRVVVEPDYETGPDENDTQALAAELAQCIADRFNPAEPITSTEGLDVAIGREFGLLKKYLRRITLHSDTVEGAWVEVVPPGNWI